MDIEKDKSFWDKKSATYDKFIERNKEAYEYMYKYLNRRIKNTDEVLEIGAGTGQIYPHIAQNVKSVIVTDYSDKMLEIAKSKLGQEGNNLDNVTFDTVNAYKLPYEDQKFDVVILANVLQALEEPEKALEEARRVMKDDGVMIVPAYMHNKTRRTKFVSKFSNSSGYRAINKWTPLEYTKYLENSNFRIIFSKKFDAPITMFYVELKNLIFPRRDPDCDWGDVM